jgi:hypothetical protein
MHPLRLYVLVQKLGVSLDYLFGLQEKDVLIDGKQREFFAKYCTGISKGALLAGMVGLGRGQLRAAFAIGDLVLAVVFFVVAYIHEGRRL